MDVLSTPSILSAGTQMTVFRLHESLYIISKTKEDLYGMHVYTRLNVYIVRLLSNKLYSL